VACCARVICRFKGDFLQKAKIGAFLSIFVIILKIPDRRPAMSQFFQKLPWDVQIFVLLTV